MAEKKRGTDKGRMSPVSANEKRKALDNALLAIEKKYGKDAIMLLGSNKTMNVEAISTGSLGLDLALGIGGLPKGRIIEVYGPESSGKTTLALHCIAECQKANGQAAFIDVEHALDPIYAEALGVDIDSLLVSQPDSGEQALEITQDLVLSGAVDIVVVDSVAALAPRAEIEGEMGDSHVGLQARLMSQAMRKLAGIISKSNVMVIFINQLRLKVGVVYGNPEVTAGGNALKYYASVRLDIRKIEAIKNGTELIGSRTRVKVIKNKVAPPYREAIFDIMYGEGISRVGELLDLAVEYEIVEKSGAWFSYGENRLGQGRDNTKSYLKENLELAQDIEDKLLAKIEKQKADELEKKNKKKNLTVDVKKPLAETNELSIDELDEIILEDDTDEMKLRSVATPVATAKPRRSTPKANIDITVED